MLKIKTFLPNEELPERLILPNQTHSTRIIEIVTGNEDLTECDAVWSRDFSKILGVKTADCAPIVSWEEDRFGLLHAGWRGFVNGITENMLDVFKNPQVFVGPFLPQFEIQRDFCYEEIKSKFGEKFFYEENQKLWFDFRKAIKSVLPMAEFDGRNTQTIESLASWRRDKSVERNVTVIGGF